MFCGNASGQYLPPMVIYKSKNVYNDWSTGGPDGAVYECTKSGWFDARTLVLFLNKNSIQNHLIYITTIEANVFLFAHISKQSIQKMIKLILK